MDYDFTRGIPQLVCQISICLRLPIIFCMHCGCVKKKKVEASGGRKIRGKEKGKERGRKRRKDIFYLFLIFIFLRKKNESHQEGKERMSKKKMKHIRDRQQDKSIWLTVDVMVECLLSICPFFSLCICTFISRNCLMQ